ncbi:hypothetical protein ASC64_17610 [Nocardioides sp. Root122]|uniref:DUF3263 domain-containing protein n=1 Tax=Nocardioides TaxID=1839 RepID=UPI000703303F|nr:MULTISPECIES: DUF3263 domain-containing protein [Nocardioides]KQV63403.1 hypothetical protein ASC64_17610 [Nocardioides sp. Root122]MCK9826067.1 DUF3263 domain-containing protein [Nocardioides cavernae]
MARDDEDRPGDDGTEGVALGLTEVEAAVLELEREFWKYPGAKDATIHDRFGWTPTRYYQVLNALIDTPAATAADPVTVNRLRRLRARRQGQRSAEREGPIS